MKLAAGSAQTILESSNPKGVAFVQLSFDSGTQRLTTASTTIDWNGASWVGLGGLIEIEPARDTESTEVVGGRLRISGVPASAISQALTENIQGRAISIWFGIMSEALALVDVPLDFVGRMNRFTFKRGNPSAELELTFESELAIARRPKIRRFTNIDQQADYPGDTFFEQISRTKEMLIRFPTAEALRK